jgi:3-phosphoshikimate 1-carboxyvinyltransferase
MTEIGTQGAPAEQDPFPTDETAWSSLQGVESVEIMGCDRPVIGRIVLPGSKSETNRALIMAACADGTSVLRGILRSEDSYWCLTTLAQLGASVSHDGEILRVAGTGARWTRATAPLFIGSAGTIARFLPGVLCAGDGEWMLRASLQLSDRPIKPLVDALVGLGADIAYVERSDRFPIRIKGRRLLGGTIQMSGALSSQFVSGLIMASPLATDAIDLHLTDDIVQPGYVVVTLTMMKQFGIDVDVDDDFRRFSIRPQSYRPASMNIAADASTASYFMALAAVTRGEMTISNLNAASEQPDIQFLRVLERLGCEVEAGDHGVRVRARGPLRGGQDFDMRALSDMVPTLAAMAPFADGPIGISGVEHIRFHESDRLAAMAASLSALGIKVEERRDGLTIWPGRPIRTRLDTYDDHRVAMSLAVLGCAADGVELRNPGCVSKTCPTFFDDLTKLGVTLRLGPAGHP